MTTVDTYMLLRAFCDELARCGMQHACTSPGSRCSPIVLSLVREPGIRCWSHLDERCAGFFALGAAKASGRPVAVTCTSGTAAANLAPAVIEAFWARIPMVVLTADRPPELRDVGAGQAIDQLKLYGNAAKWFFEVGVDDAPAQRLRWIRTLACRAYAIATTGRPGPVHLNFPLREPLVLEEPLPDDPTARPAGRPYVTFDDPAPALPRGDGLPDGRVVIIAGSGEGQPAGEAVARYAARCNVPLLADPLSGARRGAASIAHYDLLLRDPQFGAQHRPRFVIRIGDLPTSKPLRAWLAGLEDVPQIALDPHGSWHDPDAVVGRRIAAPSGALLSRHDIRGEPEWLERWRAADRLAAGAIDQVLDDELTEPVVAARLAGWLPAGATLYVASSMPVRDFESFQPVLEQPPRVLSNRGANGIDGTVSSAFGAAAAGEAPVVLVTGDVALAHDIGGLLAARRLGLAVTIVLLNNDGGGIFHFLPVAGESDAFEEHVATPHGLDFAQAAALYGCRHERTENVEDMSSLVADSLSAGATTVIEVRTNRRENLALHRRVADAARAALASLACEREAGRR
jgi:2-succinyl-5-enolpyruvyl-6-hydroxy-3-cyclohexene-1-carboxylate synthase